VRAPVSQERLEIDDDFQMRDRKVLTVDVPAAMARAKHYRNQVLKGLQ
jgi:hypothetical protein